MIDQQNLHDQMFYKRSDLFIYLYIYIKKRKEKKTNRENKAYSMVGELTSVLLMARAR